MYTRAGLLCDHWPLHSEFKADISPGHFRQRRTNLEVIFECVSQSEVGQSKTHFWVPLISKMEQTFCTPTPKPLGLAESLMAQINRDILVYKKSIQAQWYCMSHLHSGAKRSPEPIFPIWIRSPLHHLSQTILMIWPHLKYVWKAHIQTFMQSIQL